MGLDGIVRCSSGLQVVQRGFEASSPPYGVLRVRDVQPVTHPGSAPLEARRADGVVWRRHWLEPHRLVIEFVGIATVEVIEDNGDVVFDQVLPDDMEQHLLLDHVLPLVLSRRGHLVLHGGVISRKGQGVVLVGASGVGKSTLTAFAWLQGWTVGGDDGAVVSLSDPLMVEPTYATVRLTPSSAQLLSIDDVPAAEVVGKFRIDGRADGAFRQEPVPLRLVAVLAAAPEAEPANFEPLDGMSAHARLFGSTFHADLTGGRFLPAMVDRLAGVVEGATVGSLSVPRGIGGLAAAEALLRTWLQKAS